ncbi:hypothetical protein JCM5353_002274 [Sporobolomyces roseus]
MLLLRCTLDSSAISTVGISVTSLQQWTYFETSSFLRQEKALLTLHAASAQEQYGLSPRFHAASRLSLKNELEGVQGDKILGFTPFFTPSPPAGSPPLSSPLPSSPKSSINSIFAPFTLVDKRWRSIALPYLVRHYNRPSHAISGFLEFINKYNLTKEVKSIHFAFQNPLPTSVVERQADLSKESRTRQQQHDANDDRELDESATEGWLAALNARHLVLRERDVQVEEEKQPLEGDSGGWIFQGGPGQDLTHYRRLQGPNVKKLQINLLSGVSISDIDSSTPSNFPIVEDLIIHHYQGHDEDMRPAGLWNHGPTWKNLRRLTLINVAS